ncbi:MAG: tyrosine-type recombinase/integrase [Casimicrobiaceae bacterium]
MPQQTERFEFAKTRIRDLPPASPGKRDTYYDTRVPKLALRVTCAGTRTFYIVKWRAGGVAWVMLGTFPEMTVEKARKAAESALGQFADGTDPTQAKRTARAQMALGDAFEAYMTRHVEAKGKKRGADLRQLWERCVGDLPDVPKKKHAPRERSKHPAGVNWQRRRIKDISRDDVAALHVAIGKNTPTLANRVVELLSAVYNKLRDWGVAVENPANGVEPFRENKRDRFLQRGELPRFFAALANDTSDDFRDFIALALLTGARRGNVLAMRWLDIDDERAVWRIPAADAKAGETIDVALVREAAVILGERRARADQTNLVSEFVFPAASASGHMTAPKKRWAALSDRAELIELAARIKAAGGSFEWKNDGTESLEHAVTRARAQGDKLKVDRNGARLADLRLHDLRRSLGSWQAILGASLPIVGRSLGHKSPSATAIYARLDIDPVRESVERATSAMLIAGGVKQSVILTKPKRRSSKP